MKSQQKKMEYQDQNVFKISVNISYTSKCLGIQNDCYAFKSTNTFTIPARTVTTFYVNIKITEKSEGYVPRLRIQDRVYVGGAVAYVYVYEHVEKLIENNTDSFQIPGEPLEATNVLQHSIPTVDDAPIFSRRYIFPPVYKEEITRQVDELLKNKIIKPSQSPYNSPVQIVPKKPDSQGKIKWRMVPDFRKLNEKSIGDSYPLPNIKDILDSLG